MIESLVIYFLCYFLGWVPLYYFYRKLELLLPFKLVPGKVRFSWFSFLKLLYLSAEVVRAFILMEIVHQWLESDIDLFIGVALYLMAIYWPIGISSKFRTSPWIPLIGIYGYLIPYFAWIIPFLVLFLTIFNINIFLRYLFIGFLSGLIAVIFTDINNLYLGFYFFLIIMMLLKVYFSNSALISSEIKSSSIRS